MDRAIQYMLQLGRDPGLAGLGVLFAIGLFGCFLGHRFLRVSAALAGLLVGAELVGELAIGRDWSPTVTIVAALAAGVAVAVLMALVRVAGVFGLGALLAAALVSLGARAAGQAPLQPLVLLPAAGIGGLGALAARQVAVAVATSLFGALMAVAALFALVKDKSLGTAVHMIVAPQTVADVPIELPRFASPVAIFLLCVTILVTAGLVVQLRFGKSPAAGGAEEKKK